jgi:hypothetical protein
LSKPGQGHIPSFIGFSASMQSSEEGMPMARHGGSFERSGANARLAAENDRQISGANIGSDCREIDWCSAETDERYFCREPGPIAV